MQFTPVLFANASDGSGLGVFGTLFWLFLVAIIIWLLIWLLLKPGAAGGVIDDSKQAAEPEPTPAPPEPKPAPAPSPAKTFPSQAFTIWTKPPPATPAAAPEPKPEATPEPAPEPAKSLPSQAFTIWTKPPEAAPESEPDPAKTLPSQAFTIWTKPGTTPDESETEAAIDSTDESESENDSADDADPVPTLDTATAEEAAAQFQADLDSGSARQDDALGILYNAAPDDADDLKEIKGVAKVLEGKLHDFGVYKFKQIAFWTDTAVAEFAQRLTFKDRIYRDDWIAQAKKFHEQKYGEKL